MLTSVLCQTSFLRDQAAVAEVALDVIHGEELLVIVVDGINESLLPGLIESESEVFPKSPTHPVAHPVASQPRAESWAVMEEINPAGRHTRAARSTPAVHSRRERQRRWHEELQSCDGN